MLCLAVSFAQESGVRARERTRRLIPSKVFPTLASISQEDFYGWGVGFGAGAAGGAADPAPFPLFPSLPPPLLPASLGAPGLAFALNRSFKGIFSPCARLLNSSLIFSGSRGGVAVSDRDGVPGSTRGGVASGLEGPRPGSIVGPRAGSTRGAVWGAAPPLALNTSLGFKRVCASAIVSRLRTVGSCASKTEPLVAMLQVMTVSRATKFFMCTFNL